MKTKRFKLTFLACLASVIVAFLFTSCATKAHFLTSTVIPAAQGTVSVKQDKNKNYVIKIELSNLSPSTRLTPPANAYIVWLVSEDNSSKNLGQINSSTKFMSKNLNATFETVTGTKPAKIVITAENDINVEHPSFSEIILTTEYLK